MLRALLREPLLHFILLALVVFVSTTACRQQRDQSDRPRSSSPPRRSEQLASIFAETWKRPPPSRELKSLIDDYVREEIYVREALALGLDRDDTVIRHPFTPKNGVPYSSRPRERDADRRRARELPEEQARTIRDRLQAAFQQIFINPQRHGEGTEREVRSALEMLKTGPEVDPASMGDPTLLPAALPLSDKSSIGQVFGVEFADALDHGEIGQWQGPEHRASVFTLVASRRASHGECPSLEVTCVMLYCGSGRTIADRRPRSSDLKSI